MANGNRPNIRESIERAQAQPDSGHRLRYASLLRAAIFWSYPAGGLLVVYCILRWLFLGGLVTHNRFWNLLSFADYVLAVVLSLCAALWLAYLVLAFVRRRGRRYDHREASPKD